MTRPRLSVVVVTLNEEERLRACLESAAWADELIVVDALSPDKTAQIAREFTDRVILRPWPGFAAQKNFAIGEASGDWILSLDADEMVSPELRGEIARVLAEGGPHDGYRTPRRNIFWGKWVRHGGLWPDWQLRLFRRGRGRFVERAVHESVEVAGSVGRLEGPLDEEGWAWLEARSPPSSGGAAAGPRGRATWSCARSVASSRCTCCSSASSTGREAFFWLASTRTMCSSDR